MEDAGFDEIEYAQVNLIINELLLSLTYGIHWACSRGHVNPRLCHKFCHLHLSVNLHVLDPSLYHKQFIVL